MKKILIKNNKSTYFCSLLNIKAVIDNRPQYPSIDRSFYHGNWDCAMWSMVMRNMSEVLSPALASLISAIIGKTTLRTP